MGIIIDAGACVGEWLGGQWNAENEFYCFEPMKSNFTHLQSSYKDKSNVTLVNAAIGAENNVVPFYCGLEQVGISYWGGSINEDKFNNQPYEEVVVVKLSDYWKENINQSVELLKMNIEGAEYDVLEDLLDAGIINQFKMIHYQDHGVRGKKIIPSCRDKAFDIYPRLRKEFKGELKFIVKYVNGLTDEAPEYLK